MGVLSSTLKISLKGFNTGPVRNMTSALNGLKKAGSGIALGSQIAAQGRIARRAMSNMAVGVSAPLALVGASGFRAAYGLEKTMNAIQSVGDISDDSRGKFKNFFKELNKDFPFTNKEIAESALELFRAGFDEDRVRGALASSLRLAMAGDIDRAEAADIQTNVLTAMRMDTSSEQATVKSSQRVADILAYTANRSNTDVSKMGQTFKYVAPMAAAAGMEIEQVGAMAMIMANNGIKASEAGIAMRSGIVRLLKPTKEAMRILEKLNINIGDYVKGAKKVKVGDLVSGLATDGLDVTSLKQPLDKLLNDNVLAQSPVKLGAKITDLIAKGIGDETTMSRAQIAEAVQDILTASGSKVDLAGFYKALQDKRVDLAEFVRINDVKQGSRLMTLLTGDIGAKTQEILDRSYGYAEKASKVRMKGIVGSVARLNAAWENLFVTIGDSGVLDSLSRAFDTVANTLTSISQTSPGLLKAATYAGMALAVMGPLGFMMSGVSSMFTLIGASARMAALSLLFVGRAATVGVASLAVSGIAAAWGGVAGAIRNAKIAYLGFMAMSVQGGKMFAIKTALASIGAGLLSILSPIRLVKAAMVALRAAFMMTGVGAVIAGIAAAGTFIYNNWSGIKEMFAGIGEGFMSSLGPARPLVEGIGTAVSQLVGWISDLVGPLDASKEQWRSWGQAIGKALAWPIKMLGKLYGLLRDNALANWLFGKRAETKPSEAPGKKAAALIADNDNAPPPANSASKPKTASPGTAAASTVTDISAVKNEATGAVGVVQDAMNQIKATADLDLTPQGMKIMDTLAAGMRAKAAAAIAVMRDTAQQLRDHLPSSPAKTGPLSDLHRLKFGETIASSINGAPMVAAMRQVTGETLKAASPNDNVIQFRPLRTAASAGNGSTRTGETVSVSIGDIHVSVASTNASPQQIGEEVGRRVRDAVRSAYSDGGL